MSGAPTHPDAAAADPVSDPDPDRSSADDAMSSGAPAGSAPAGDRPDPLAALVRLAQEPTADGRPSDALARWARTQEAQSRPPAANGSATAPARTGPPPAVADRASGALDTPFSVLSLDAVQAAAAEQPVAAGPAPSAGPMLPAGAVDAPVAAAATAVTVGVAASVPPASGSAASGPDRPPGAASGSAALFDHAAVGVDETGEHVVGAAAPAPVAEPRQAPPKASGGLGPFWRWGFPIVILVLALAVPVLVKVGQRTVLQSTDGRLLNQVTDPAAPGFQIITEPTPTMLLVQTDEAGVANGLTVMSLTGAGSGGMIFIPMTTVLELAGIGNIPLDAAAARAGLEGLQKAVEGVLGVGMAEVAVVDPQGWADLVAPLGTLTVENPDDVKVAGTAADKTVLFPKGTITLTPADVPVYLQTLSPGENDLNRLVRHQAFWDAWLRAVGTSDDPAVVPGESSSGLGRFVRELAADRVDMGPLPVKGASIPGSDLAVYLPVDEQVTALVARVVPFPIGAPPGARPRVRLLDGTGSLDHGLGAVGTVVAAGGQVDQIGNADAFGTATTTFQYSDDARLPEVERLQAAFGVGEIVKSSSDLPAIDVTIVLGEDYAAQPPPTLAPVTTAVR